MLLTCTYICYIDNGLIYRTGVYSISYSVTAVRISSRILITQVVIHQQVGGWIIGREGGKAVIMYLHVYIVTLIAD